MTGTKLYEEGLDSYPTSTVVVENILMLVWFGLGTYLSGLMIAWLGLAYLAFALLMVGVVLRRLVCANCWYFGKRCHTGWGKLSALMFRPGDVARFSACTGVKLAPPTYGLLTVVPLGLGLWAVIASPAARVIGIVALVLLLGVSVYSGAIGRKQACARCKMRLVCPGSGIAAPGPS